MFSSDDDVTLLPSYVIFSSKNYKSVDPVKVTMSIISTSVNINYSSHS